MATMGALFPLIEKLTGQVIPFPECKEKIQDYRAFKEPGLGHREFNELMLTLGYNRVTRAFFDCFFADDVPGTEPYQIQLPKPPSQNGHVAVVSVEQFERGVTRFRKCAALFYGNIRFAFRRLSRLSDSGLRRELQEKDICPDDEKAYKNRPKPIHELKPIEEKYCYYVGKTFARSNVPSEVAQEVDQIDAAVRNNLDAYLTSDYLDVYVAVSMRERYHFYYVHKFVEQLGSNRTIRDLNLRFFDPTKADCVEKLDKGLVEALMLKRARCTIYMVQESDSFGKDSELAATLAQGKPVIAFVPKLSNQARFEAEVQELLTLLYSDSDQREEIGKAYKSFGGTAKDEPGIKDLYQVAKTRFDQRNEVLRTIHPLSMQVHLETGVANGVLVVRLMEDCAKLLRRVILNTLEFDLTERPCSDARRPPGTEMYLELKEKISGCPYRVVTGDRAITNSFWNFYFEERRQQSPGALTGLDVDN